MKIFNTLLMFITISGGFNWFMIGVFDVNLVNSFLQPSFMAKKVCYVIIGMASLYCLRLLKLVYHTR